MAQAAPSQSVVCKARRGLVHDRECWSRVQADRRISQLVQCSTSSNATAPTRRKQYERGAELEYKRKVELEYKRGTEVETNCGASQEMVTTAALLLMPPLRSLP